VVILSAAAMVAVGLLIGAIAPTARSAGAAATVLFFPLMYFAGLWTPQMSASAKHIGQFTPLGAATQALGDSMSGGWPHPAAFAVLGVCTLVCAGLAARFFRWE
jgi:ABC-2 type transport system permease protein